MTCNNSMGMAQNGNHRDQPIFTLTHEMKSIIDGSTTLTWSMVDNIMTSSRRHANDWRSFGWLGIMTTEEVSALKQLMQVLPSGFNSPLQALLLIYCFADV